MRCNIYASSVLAGSFHVDLSWNSQWKQGNSKPIALNVGVALTPCQSRPGAWCPGGTAANSGESPGHAGASIGAQQQMWIKRYLILDVLGLETIKKCHWNCHCWWFDLREHFSQHWRATWHLNCCPIDRDLNGWGSWPRWHLVMFYSTPWDKVRCHACDMSCYPIPCAPERSYSYVWLMSSGENIFKPLRTLVQRSNIVMASVTLDGYPSEALQRLHVQMAWWLLHVQPNKQCLDRRSVWHHCDYLAIKRNLPSGLLENPPIYSWFSLLETSICSGFPIAMFHYQMVKGARLDSRAKICYPQCKRQWDLKPLQIIHVWSLVWYPLPTQNRSNEGPIIHMIPELPVLHRSATWATNGERS